MTQREVVLYQVRRGAAWITLNRPDARNALSDELVASLTNAIERALSDDAVRCLIVTGAGKAFCSGADLKGARGSRADKPSLYVEVLRRIWTCSKPVIAAVNGAAYAGGLGLVGACDIVVASEVAKFSFSEVRIGVIPAVISVVCVPKLGAGQAMRLFLTGATFDAVEAKSYGLVHHVARETEFHAVVDGEVAAIMKASPHALAEAKMLVRRIAQFDIDEQFRWAQIKSRELFASDEAQEGIAAFREKRQPKWVVSE